VQIEKVESILTQGGEGFRVLSALAGRLLGKSEGAKSLMTSGGEEEPAVGIRELEIRL